MFFKPVTVLTLRYCLVWLTALALTPSAAPGAEAYPLAVQNSQLPTLGTAKRHPNSWCFGQNKSKPNAAMFAVPANSTLCSQIGTICFKPERKHSSIVRVCLRPSTDYIVEGVSQVTVSATPSDNNSPAENTITVNSADQLQVALESAAYGTVIVLAPGNYGDLTLSAKQNPQLQFSGEVIIRSIDPQNPAVFTGVTLNGVENLTFIR